MQVYFTNIHTSIGWKQNNSTICAYNKTFRLAYNDWSDLLVQLTLVILTSGNSTLRICQRICKVPNWIPIHCIYNFAYFSNLNMF